jgi:hypothetical protein
MAHVPMILDENDDFKFINGFSRNMGK